MEWTIRGGQRRKVSTLFDATWKAYRRGIYKHQMGLEARSLMREESCFGDVAGKASKCIKKWTTANVSLITVIYDCQVQSLFFPGTMPGKQWYILIVPFRPRSKPVCPSSGKSFSSQGIIQSIVFQLSDLQQSDKSLCWNLVLPNSHTFRAGNLSLLQKVADFIHYTWYFSIAFSKSVCPPCTKYTISSHT